MQKNKPGSHWRKHPQTFAVRMVDLYKNVRSLLFPLDLLDVTIVGLIISFLTAIVIIWTCK